MGLALRVIPALATMLTRRLASIVTWVFRLCVVVVVIAAAATVHRGML